MDDRIKAIDHRSSAIKHVKSPDRSSEVHPPMKDRGHLPPARPLLRRSGRPLVRGFLRGSRLARQIEGMSNRVLRTLIDTKPADDLRKIEILGGEEPIVFERQPGQPLADDLTAGRRGRPLEGRDAGLQPQGTLAEARFGSAGGGPRQVRPGPSRADHQTLGRGHRRPPGLARSRSRQPRPPLRPGRRVRIDRRRRRQGARPLDQAPGCPVARP